MINDAVIVPSVRVRLTIFKEKKAMNCLIQYGMELLSNQQNLGSLLVFHLSNNNHCHLVLRHPGVNQSKSKHLHKHQEHLRRHILRRLMKVIADDQLLYDKTLKRTESIQSIIVF